MKFKTIAIVGLGLMGGSLAAACRKKFPKSRLIGISRDVRALRFAKKKKWVHEAAKDLRSLASANLIILCTPVDTLKSMLVKIDKFAARGTLVTDVGSVKGEVARWARGRRFRNIQFVGSHPMTGSHERGISAARPDLYQNSFTFVTPGAKFVTGAVRNFWRKLGSRVVVLSAEEHDKITAEISHLPHLAAVCLALTPQTKSFQHAGPGFSDATRIAQGHPSIWVPIFRSNRRSVLDALKGFQKNLRHFQKALQKGGRDLDKILTSAVKRRRKIAL